MHGYIDMCNTHKASQKPHCAAIMKSIVCGSDVLHDSNKYFPISFAVSIRISDSGLGVIGIIYDFFTLSYDELCCSIWPVHSSAINSLRPRQNGSHVADDIFKHIFLNENVKISIWISPKFVPKDPINNIPALVRMMTWRRPSNNPLSEPTRYVDGTPTSEVTLVTIRYIRPPHHGHTSQYHDHEWMTHILFVHCQSAVPFLR